MGVVLFSGHMVDAPDREHPRFPPDHVPAVRRHIARAVSAIGEPDTQAVSGLACGGDLLFAEQWLLTGRHLRAFLPRPVDEFLEESVRFAGNQWVELFHAVTTKSTVTLIPPEDDMIGLDDPHTPNSLRMLAAALSEGVTIHGVFLWDGQGEDGPGGTRYMVSAVRKRGGSLTVIPP